MMLPLVQPSHCLTCQKELLLIQERPERFCSYPCMMAYYVSPEAICQGQELTPVDLYLLNLREKMARVGADLQASMAMRELTGTPLSEEDLAGLRWLAKPDPVAEAVAWGLPIPPGINLPKIGSEEE